MSTKRNFNLIKFYFYVRFIHPSVCPSVRPSVPFEELWKVCVCFCLLFMKRPPCKWAGGDLELGGISCLSNCQEKEQKNKPLFNTFWQNTPFSVSLLLVFMTHQTINQIAANLHQISAIATNVWRLFSIRSCSVSARELEIGTRAGLFCYGYVPFHSIRLCSGSAFWIWISGLLMCMCVS